MFQAYNPPDNSSPTSTLTLALYDDSSFAHKIDEITSGMNPTY